MDFVNSLFADHTGHGRIFDRLESPEWQRWFANRCDVRVEGAPRDAVRERLVALRDLLRRLMESERLPEGSDLAQLNRFLEPAQSWQLSRTGQQMDLGLRWQKDDWYAVMAATVASYANLLVTGELRRIRQCSNPNCTFMFYDDSRSRSRRWCDVKSCGNLVKVRRHRALHPRNAPPSR
jgi:predicted RNA-binding Zn ribbon-like protein